PGRAPGRGWPAPRGGSAAERWTFRSRRTPRGTRTRPSRPPGRRHGGLDGSVWGRPWSRCRIGPRMHHGSPGVDERALTRSGRPPAVTARGYAAVAPYVRHVRPGCRGNAAVGAGRADFRRSWHSGGGTFTAPRTFHE